MGRMSELAWERDSAAGPVDHGELLAIDVASAIDRYINSVESGNAAVRPHWDALALASDKLSHFLNKTKARNAA